MDLLNHSNNFEWFVILGQTLRLQLKLFQTFSVTNTKACYTDHVRRSCNRLFLTRWILAQLSSSQWTRKRCEKYLWCAYWSILFTNWKFLVFKHIFSNLILTITDWEERWKKLKQFQNPLPSGYVQEYTHSSSKWVKDRFFPEGLKLMKWPIWKLSVPSTSCAQCFSEIVIHLLFPSDRISASFSISDSVRPISQHHLSSMI